MFEHYALLGEGTFVWLNMVHRSAPNLLKLIPKQSLAAL